MLGQYNIYWNKDLFDVPNGSAGYLDDISQSWTLTKATLNSFCVVLVEK